MTKLARLPKTIKWPGGFTIQVKQTKKIHEYGHWVGEHAGGTIRLKEDEDLPRKWRTLAHELVHAAIDYHHYIEEEVARPVEIEMGQTMAALEDE